MRLLRIIIPAFLISCNNSAVPADPPSDSTLQDGTVVADTPQTLITDTLLNTPEPQGIYTATIACKGCPSIEQTVAFLPGRMYKMEEKAAGKPIQKSSGTWTPSGGTIWLYKDQVVKARYRWRDDTLHYLHPNASLTRMEKRIAATDNDVWRKKGKEGLEFYGVGNEPFWNIDIDEQQGIKFQLADWDKPAEFSPVKPVISTDSLVYTTGKDTARVTAIVYHTFCSDGMSDFVYTQRVVVRYKGAAYNGCGILFRR